VERVLEILVDSHVDLKKLILKYCDIGDEFTGILSKVVALNPELETLSLVDCHVWPNAASSLVPRLKKLSELNLSHLEVYYVHIKPLQPHVSIFEQM
jgi:Ran GTPase-activating protein (RanGAP) involved in mRNA processing and transport